MDDSVQRTLRELRRSGATWREVVQALAAECQDLNVSENETAEIVSEALLNQVDRRNFLAPKCIDCGHPKYWHSNGWCLDPPTRVSVRLAYNPATGNMEFFGYTIDHHVHCTVCNGRRQEISSRG